MAFIRKRISPTGRRTLSYQLIETYREGGKVKQRVLANLGRCSTVEEALEDTRRHLELAARCLSEGKRYLRRWNLICKLGSDKPVVEKQVERLRRQAEALERVVSKSVRRRTIPDTTGG